MGRISDGIMSKLAEESLKQFIEDENLRLDKTKRL